MSAKYKDLSMIYKSRDSNKVSAASCSALIKSACENSILWNDLWILYILCVLVTIYAI